MSSVYYTPQKAPDTRFVFVGQGIGPKDGPWMTLYLKYPYNKGNHRLKSPALPLRPTEQEAQADLDKYAKMHGFREIVDTR